MIITKWRLTLVIFQIMISNMNLSTISTEIAHTMGRCWGSVTTCGEATRIVPGLTVMGVFCLAVTAVTESTSISLWISTLFKPIHSSQRVQNSTYVSSIPSKSSTKSWSKLFCLVLILRKIYLPLYHISITQILPKYCKLLPKLCIQQYIYYLSGITKQFNKSFH